MASPVADTYSASSGVPVYGGRYALGGRASGEALLAAIAAGGGMGVNASELAGAAVLAGAAAGGSLGSFPDPIAPPTLNATRAHALNVDTGQQYYVKNANFTDTIPASITKIMTCYTLFRSKSYAALDDTVTVVSDDLQTGSGAIFLAGDVVSYRDLIAAAMLPSSNTACHIIARGIGLELLGGAGDGFARFMTEMNTLSDAIGMPDSTWYNPAGLNGGDYVPTTSTNITHPYDMNVVTGLAWEYAAMAEMWNGGAQYYDISVLRSGTPTTITLENFSSQRLDTGILGAKGGSTTYHNLVNLWQAPSGDRIAITVINGGSTGRLDDCRAIIAQLPIDFPELA